MKFKGTKYTEEIQKLKRPGDAAYMGRRRDLPFRQDWESVKENVMKKALLAKFTQHKDLCEKLLATCDEKLVEHTTRDAYWGDGGGSGKNRLGYLLMEIRQTLQKQK